MTSDKLLKVKRLWKVFAPKGANIDVNDSDALAQAEEMGAVSAVKGVSLEVARGEFFVIMGLSGSGKSTLIRCLLRLVEPTSGEIWADGQEVTGLDEAGLIQFRRDKVAMVFQHYGLLPHKTVLENAAFGLKLKGVSLAERQERAKESLELVGLAGWEDHHPAALSGGMQQRVGIARALAMNPTLLLMDEPFSGLDPLIRKDMQDELVALQERLNVTTVFVTHDLDEAVHLGDRMAIMRDGEVVQLGEPDEILRNPADRYVERFVEGRDLSQRRRLASVPKAQGKSVPLDAAEGA